MKIYFAMCQQCKLDDNYNYICKYFFFKYDNNKKQAIPFCNKKNESCLYAQEQINQLHDAEGA